MRTRSYGQFCPVSKAAEVFAERWTPLILRDLLAGNHRFSELQQGVPGMSQSLLTQRLRSLERAGVVERRLAARGRGWEYHLTPAGEEFGQVVEQLGAWGQRWAMDRLSPEDLDPRLVMWALARHLNVERLPAQRTVVRFELRAPRYSSWWLVLQGAEVDLCLKDPGWEVDLVVTADPAALVQVHLGRLPLPEAVRQGAITIEGPRALVQAFPEWIGLSRFAHFARASPPPPMHRMGSRLSIGDGEAARG